MAAREARWWKTSDGQEPHEILSSVVTRLRDQQGTRKENLARYARLYGNMPIAGINVFRTAKLATPQRLALNIVKSCCQAATSKITKNRPKPTFLTSGGDYVMQQRAKQLDKFVEGQFYESKLYELAPQIFLDCCIFGTGVVKVYEHDESIVVERVLPWEVMTDEADAIYGLPRSFYHRKFYDRQVLAELFPKKRAKIDDAANPDDFEDFDYDSLADQVLVTEAWHLPSARGSKDGRHVIAIDGATLLSEPYDEDTFPFAFMRWTNAPVGFWGIGLAEELTGLQLEINKLLREFQQAHHLLGKAHWMVDNASKVVTSHLDNDIGTIIRGNFAGSMMPQVYVPQVVSPDAYQYLWSLVEKCYEITGISQLSAQSQKPAGLNSGKALDTFNDIQTERFVTVARAYENFFLEVARQMIGHAQQIAEDHPDYAVRAMGKAGFERIRWQDVNLKADEYVMQMFPTNALASDPASRIQQVSDMMDKGMLGDPDYALELLDFPDVEKFNRMKTAARRNVEKMIAHMLDKGEYQSPEPYDNLQLNITMARDAYHDARAIGAPEPRLELLRRFMNDSNELANPTPPPAPLMPPAPMMGPANDITMPPANDVAGPPMNDVAPPMPMAPPMGVG